MTHHRQPMRSYIVRVYRRGQGGAVSGTVQVVDGRGNQPPLAFSSVADLLACLKPRAGARDATDPSGATVAADTANTQPEVLYLPPHDARQDDASSA